MAASMAKSKAGVSDEDNDSLCKGLSFEDRLMGFAACFGIGVLCTFLSVFMFPRVLLGRPGSFAYLYTMGNVFSLGSSTFIIGPKQQWKNMTDPKRRLCAGTYVGMMFCTLFFALGMAQFTGQMFVILLCVLVQLLAGFYYMASYIPFGRKVLAKCFKTTAKAVT